MFLPGDPALYNGQPITITDTIRACGGHVVAFNTADGKRHVVAEYEVQRPPPSFGDMRPLRNAELFMMGFKLKALLPALPIDWRGHHLDGAAWTGPGWYRSVEERKEQLFHNAGFAYGDYVVPTLEEGEAILAAVAAGVPLDRFIPVVTGERGLTCGHCNVVDFETDGQVVRPVAPCPNPGGLVTEFTLNVPSGKIIIDDDLRDLCRIASERDINSRWGVHQAILDYAAHGLALGFGIGNTCPVVARQKGGLFTIGKGQGGRKLASVCTGLWAYSIIDHDEAVRRAAYYGIKPDWAGVTVQIPAGLYKFRHFHDIDRDASKVLFATFERVGDAVEPEDWCAKDAAFTVHVTQGIQHLLKAWPTLYADDDPDWRTACARVLRAEFAGCVPDRDWHRNGHRNHYLPEDVAGLEIREIPRLRLMEAGDSAGSAIEVTVAGKCRMFGGDIPLNASYAVAAARLLESRISFGIRPIRTGARDAAAWIARARDDMHKAAALWPGLLKRYPHAADDMQDFAAWMEDRGAVTRWVDHFNLGAPPKEVTIPDDEMEAQKKLADKIIEEIIEEERAQKEAGGAV